MRFVNQKQLAELLGVDRESIRLWHRDKGLPRCPDGKFDVPVVIRWAAGNKETDPDTVHGAKLALVRAQTSQTNLKNAEVRATLVDRDQADAAFGQAKEIAKGHLDTLADKHRDQPLVMNELLHAVAAIMATPPAWETDTEEKPDEL